MTGTQFTESVCAKFSAPAVFDPKRLPNRLTLFAEILKAARTPKLEGGEDVQPKKPN